MDTTPSTAIPRVLSIAGTDPTGGAGHAADLKSIAALGGYGLSVITAVVAQNTQGIVSVHTPPVQVLRDQLDAVARDVTLDAIKVGMLGSVEVIDTVRDWLMVGRAPVVVIDPVMVATAGGRLLRPDAERALRELLPHADLITPNLPELAVLAERPVAGTWDEALEQGRAVAAAFHTRVLVKGGHLAGDTTPDALLLPGQLEPAALFEGRRVHTHNTHGTGCSLSSAVATVVARTGDWPEAIRTARTWLRGALRGADELHVGHGNGPVHHMHHVQHLIADPSFVTLAAGESDAPRFTDELWEQSAPVRERIAALAFIRGLGDGTLDPAEFEQYLDQDMQYLQYYSRALALLAASAPDERSREHFAAASASVVSVESALHRARLGDREPSPPSEVTSSYADFLLARTGQDGFAVGSAAILPCYWLYAHVGAELTRRARVAGPQHPFADWLSTYDDPDFQSATESVREIVDREAAHADPATREHMRRAFHRACELELAFFAQTTRATSAGTAAPAAAQLA